MNIRRVAFHTERETYDEQVQAGRYNPGLVLHFRDKRGVHRVPIGAGYSDDVDAFRCGEETFILTTNRGLGYVGLEIYNGDDYAGDIFFSMDHQIDDALGPMGLDLRDYNIVKRLNEYIY